MDNVREILGFEASVSIIIKIKVAIVQKKKILAKKKEKEKQKQKPQTVQTISIHSPKRMASARQEVVSTI